MKPRAPRRPVRPHDDRAAKDAERFVANAVQLCHDHARLLRRARRKTSGRRVHGLRIGTRRLLARLEVLRPLAPSPGLKRTRRRLKRLLRLTGPARDACVQLQLLTQLTPSSDAPGLRSLRRHLRKRYRRLRRELARKLKRTAPMAGGQFAPLALSGARFHQAVGAALRRAGRRVFARQRFADSADPRDSHRLRVALKKFRYLTEALPAAPAPARTAGLARLQRAQSVLGDRHDLDLLLLRMEQYGSRHPATARWLRSRRGAFQRRQALLARRLPPLRFSQAQLAMLAGRGGKP
jgi:CHAD domain-containing protein